MQKVITYHADGYFHPFATEEEALAYEARMKELWARLADNSSSSKFNLLVAELEAARVIPEGTLATCSYESLAIKAMVKVCQKFVEDNKKFLDYY